jgi:hypothetical protein
VPESTQMNAIDGIEVDALLARFPEPASVYPSGTKLMVHASVIVLVLCGLPLLAFLSPDLAKLILLDPIILIGIVIAPCCLAAYARRLLYRSPLLTLDRQSLVVMDGQWKQEIRWSDISDIRVEEGFFGNRRLRLKHRFSGDTIIVLPGLYRDAVTADDLALLMHGWRERAMPEQPPPLLRVARA